MRGANYVPGIYHTNNLTWGPLHIYWSSKTGKRVAFRANEIESVTARPYDTAVVKTLGGYEFDVTSAKPEKIS